MINTEYIKEDLQRFVEDLEETVLRLHVNARGVEEQFDQFKKSNGLRKKKTINIKHVDDQLRKELEARDEYGYYQGKMMAYMFVLENLGSEIPTTIGRLRGIMQVRHNMMMETKAHYSEIKGHFETDMFKKWKAKK